MLPIYKETYTTYTSRNGNTQLLLYRRKKTRNKEDKQYFIMQKLAGLTMALIGLISPIACDGDGTFLLFALPIGIYLLLTKNKIMTF